MPSMIIVQPSHLQDVFLQYCENELASLRQWHWSSTVMICKTGDNACNGTTQRRYKQKMLLI